MHEYKTLFADSPPSAEQLTALSRDGWELVLIVPHEKQLLVYLRRAAATN